MEGSSQQNDGYMNAQQPPPQQPPYQEPPQYQQPYQQPMYGPQPPPLMPPPVPMAQPPQQTIKPILAGIFLIIAGIEGLALGGALAAAGSVFGDAFGGLPGGDTVANIVIVCGVMFMIFGILALLGGIMSITRKKWGLAIIGSIFGLFCLGFVFYEASILSLIALILILISRDEFQ